jgi:hypothetical protein
MLSIDHPRFGSHFFSLFTMVGGKMVARNFARRNFGPEIEQFAKRGSV